MFEVLPQAAMSDAPSVLRAFRTFADIRTVPGASTHFLLVPDFAGCLEEASKLWWAVPLESGISLIPFRVFEWNGMPVLAYPQLGLRNFRAAFLDDPEHRELARAQIDAWPQTLTPAGKASTSKWRSWLQHRGGMQACGLEHCAAVRGADGLLWGWAPAFAWPLDPLSPRPDRHHRIMTGHLSMRMISQLVPAFAEAEMQELQQKHKERAQPTGGADEPQVAQLHQRGMQIQGVLMEAQQAMMAGQPPQQSMEELQALQQELMHVAERLQQLEGEQGSGGGQHEKSQVEFVSDANMALRRAVRRAEAAVSTVLSSQAGLQGALNTAVSDFAALMDAGAIAPVTPAALMQSLKRFGLDELHLPLVKAACSSGSAQRRLALDMVCQVIRSQVQSLGLAVLSDAQAVARTRTGSSSLEEALQEGAVPVPGHANAAVFPSPSMAHRATHASQRAFARHLCLNRPQAGRLQEDLKQCIRSQWAAIDAKIGPHACAAPPGVLATDEAVYSNVFLKEKGRGDLHRPARDLGPLSDSIFSRLWSKFMEHSAVSEYHTALVSHGLKVDASLSIQEPNFPQKVGIPEEYGLFPTLELFRAAVRVTVEAAFEEWFEEGENGSVAELTKQSREDWCDAVISMTSDGNFEAVSANSAELAASALTAAFSTRCILFFNMLFGSDDHFVDLRKAALTASVLQDLEAHIPSEGSLLGTGSASESGHGPDWCRVTGSGWWLAALPALIRQLYGPEVSLGLPGSDPRVSLDGLTVFMQALQVHLQWDFHPSIDWLQAVEGVRGPVAATVKGPLHNGITGALRWISDSAKQVLPSPGMSGSAAESGPGQELGGGLGAARDSQAKAAIEAFQWASTHPLPLFSSHKVFVCVDVTMADAEDEDAGPEQGGRLEPAEIHARVQDNVSNRRHLWHGLKASHFPPEVSSQFEHVKKRARWLKHMEWIFRLGWVARCGSLAVSNSVWRASLTATPLNMPALSRAGCQNVAMLASGKAALIAGAQSASEHMALAVACASAMHPSLDTQLPVEADLARRPAIPVAPVPYLFSPVSREAFSDTGSRLVEQAVADLSLFAADLPYLGTHGMESAGKVWEHVEGQAWHLNSASWLQSIHHSPFGARHHVPLAATYGLPAPFSSVHLPAVSAANHTTGILQRMSILSRVPQLLGFDLWGTSVSAALGVAFELPTAAATVPFCLQQQHLLSSALRQTQSDLIQRVGHAAKTLPPAWPHDSVVDRGAAQVSALRSAETPARPSAVLPMPTLEQDELPADCAAAKEGWTAADLRSASHLVPDEGRGLLFGGLLAWPSMTEGRNVTFHGAPISHQSSPKYDSLVESAVCAGSMPAASLVFGSQSPLVPIIASQSNLLIRGMEHQEAAKLCVVALGQVSASWGYASQYASTLLSLGDALRVQRLTCTESDLTSFLAKNRRWGAVCCTPDASQAADSQRTTPSEHLGLSAALRDMLPGSSRHDAQVEECAARALAALKRAGSAWGCAVLPNAEAEGGQFDGAGLSEGLLAAVEAMSSYSAQREELLESIHATFDAGFSSPALGSLFPLPEQLQIQVQLESTAAGKMDVRPERDLESFLATLPGGGLIELWVDAGQRVDETAALPPAAKWTLASSAWRAAPLSRFCGTHAPTCGTPLKDLLEGTAPIAKRSRATWEKKWRSLGLHSFPSTESHDPVKAPDPAPTAVWDAQSHLAGLLAPTSGQVHAVHVGITMAKYDDAMQSKDTESSIDGALEAHTLGFSRRAMQRMAQSDLQEFPGELDSDGHDQSALRAYAAAYEALLCAGEDWGSPIVATALLKISQCLPGHESEAACFARLATALDALVCAQSAFGSHSLQLLPALAHAASVLADVVAPDTAACLPELCFGNTPTEQVSMLCALREATETLLSWSQGLLELADVGVALKPNLADTDVATEGERTVLAAGLSEELAGALQQKNSAVCAVVEEAATHLHQLDPLRALNRAAHVVQTAASGAQVSEGGHFAVPSAADSDDDASQEEDDDGEDVPAEAVPATSDAGERTEEEQARLALAGVPGHWRTPLFDAAVLLRKQASATPAAVWGKPDPSFKVRLQPMQCAELRASLSLDVLHRLPFAEEKITRAVHTALLSAIGAVKLQRMVKVALFDPEAELGAISCLRSQILTAASTMSVADPDLAVQHASDALAALAAVGRFHWTQELTAQALAAVPELSQKHLPEDLQSPPGESEPLTEALERLRSRCVGGHMKLRWFRHTASVSMNRGDGSTPLPGLPPNAPQEFVSDPAGLNLLQEGVPAALPGLAFADVDAMCKGASDVVRALMFTRQSPTSVVPWADAHSQLCGHLPSAACMALSRALGRMATAGSLCNPNWLRVVSEGARVTSEAAASGALHPERCPTWAARYLRSQLGDDTAWQCTAAIQASNTLRSLSTLMAGAALATSGSQQNASGGSATRWSTESVVAQSACIAAAACDTLFGAPLSPAMEQLARAELSQPCRGAAWAAVIGGCWGSWSKVPGQPTIALGVIDSVVSAHALQSLIHRRIAASRQALCHTPPVCGPEGYAKQNPTTPEAVGQFALGPPSVRFTSSFMLAMALMMDRVCGPDGNAMLQNRALASLKPPALQSIAEVSPGTGVSACMPLLEGMFAVQAMVPAQHSLERVPLFNSRELGDFESGVGAIGLEPDDASQSCFPQWQAEQAFLASLEGSSGGDVPSTKLHLPTAFSKELLSAESPPVMPRTADPGRGCFAACSVVFTAHWQAVSSILPLNIATGEYLSSVLGSCVDATSSNAEARAAWFTKYTNEAAFGSMTTRPSDMLMLWAVLGPSGLTVGDAETDDAPSSLSSGGLTDQRDSALHPIRRSILHGALVGTASLAYASAHAGLGAFGESARGVSEQLSVAGSQGASFLFDRALAWSLAAGAASPLLGSAKSLSVSALSAAAQNQAMTLTVASITLPALQCLRAGPSEDSGNMLKPLQEALNRCTSALTVPSASSEAGMLTGSMFMDAIRSFCASDPGLAQAPHPFDVQSGPGTTHFVCSDMFGSGVDVHVSLTALTVALGCKVCPVPDDPREEALLMHLLAEAGVTVAIVGAEGPTSSAEPGRAAWIGQTYSLPACHHTNVQEKCFLAVAFTRLLRLGISTIMAAAHILVDPDSGNVVSGDGGTVAAVARIMRQNLGRLGSPDVSVHSGWLPFLGNKLLWHHAEAVTMGLGTMASGLAGQRWIAEVLFAHVVKRTGIASPNTLLNATGKSFRYGIGCQHPLVDGELRIHLQWDGESRRGMPGPVLKLQMVFIPTSPLPTPSSSVHQYRRMMSTLFGHPFSCALQRYGAKFFVLKSAGSTHIAVELEMGDLWTPNSLSQALATVCDVLNGSQQLLAAAVAAAQPEAADGASTLPPLSPPATLPEKHARVPQDGRAEGEFQAGSTWLELQDAESEHTLGAWTRLCKKVWVLVKNLPILDVSAPSRQSLRGAASSSLAHLPPNLQAFQTPLKLLLPLLRLLVQDEFGPHHWAVTGDFVCRMFVLGEVLGLPEVTGLALSCGMSALFCERSRQALRAELLQSAQELLGAEADAGSRSYGVPDPPSDLPEQLQRAWSCQQAQSAAGRLLATGRAGDATALHLGLLPGAESLGVAARIVTAVHEEAPFDASAVFTEWTKTLELAMKSCLGLSVTEWWQAAVNEVLAASWAVESALAAAGSPTPQEADAIAQAVVAEQAPPSPVAPLASLLVPEVMQSVCSLLGRAESGDMQLQYLGLGGGAAAMLAIAAGLPIGARALRLRVPYLTRTQAYERAGVEGVPLRSAEPQVGSSPPAFSDQLTGWHELEPLLVSKQKQAAYREHVLWEVARGKLYEVLTGVAEQLRDSGPHGSSDAALAERYALDSYPYGDMPLLQWSALAALTTCLSDGYGVHIFLRHVSLTSVLSFSLQFVALECHMNAFRAVGEEALQGPEMAAAAGMPESAEMGPELERLGSLLQGMFSSNFSFGTLSLLMVTKLGELATAVICGPAEAAHVLPAPILSQPHLLNPVWWTPSASGAHQGPRGVSLGLDGISGCAGPVRDDVRQTLQALGPATRQAMEVSNHAFMQARVSAALTAMIARKDGSRLGVFSVLLAALVCQPGPAGQAASVALHAALKGLTAEAIAASMVKTALIFRVGSGTPSPLQCFGMPVDTFSSALHGFGTDHNTQAALLVLAAHLGHPDAVSVLLGGPEHEHTVGGPTPTLGMLRLFSHGGSEATGLALSSSGPVLSKAISLYMSGQPLCPFVRDAPLGVSGFNPSMTAMAFLLTALLGSAELACAVGHAAGHQLEEQLGASWQEVCLALIDFPDEQPGTEESKQQSVRLLRQYLHMAGAQAEADSLPSAGLANVGLDPVSEASSASSQPTYSPQLQALAATLGLQAESPSDGLSMIRAAAASDPATRLSFALGAKIQHLLRALHVAVALLPWSPRLRDTWRDEHYFERCLSVWDIGNCDQAAHMGNIMARYAGAVLHGFSSDAALGDVTTQAAFMMETALTPPTQVPMPGLRFSWINEWISAELVESQRRSLVDRCLTSLHMSVRVSVVATGFSDGGAYALLLRMLTGCTAPVRTQVAAQLLDGGALGPLLVHLALSHLCVGPSLGMLAHLAPFLGTAPGPAAAAADELVRIAAYTPSNEDGSVPLFAKGALPADFLCHGSEDTFSSGILVPRATAMALLQHVVRDVAAATLATSAAADTVFIAATALGALYPNTNAVALAGRLAGVPCSAADLQALPDTAIAAFDWAVGCSDVFGLREVHCPIPLKHTLFPSLIQEHRGIVDSWRCTEGPSPGDDASPAYPWAAGVGWAEAGEHTVKRVAGFAAPPRGIDHVEAAEYVPAPPADAHSAESALWAVQRGVQSVRGMACAQQVAQRMLMSFTHLLSDDAMSGTTVLVVNFHPALADAAYAGPAAAVLRHVGRFVGSATNNGPGFGLDPELRLLCLGVIDAMDRIGQLASNTLTAMKSSPSCQSAYQAYVDCASSGYDATGHPAGGHLHVLANMKMVQEGLDWQSS